jgi:hypothetical protein
MQLSPARASRAPRAIVGRVRLITMADLTTGDLRRLELAERAQAARMVSDGESSRDRGLGGRPCWVWSRPSASTMGQVPPLRPGPAPRPSRPVPFGEETTLDMERSELRLVSQADAEAAAAPEPEDQPAEYCECCGCCLVSGGPGRAQVAAPYNLTVGKGAHGRSVLHMKLCKRCVDGLVFEIDLLVRRNLTSGDKAV